MKSEGKKKTRRKNEWVGASISYLFLSHLRSLFRLLPFSPLLYSSRFLSFPSALLSPLTAHVPSSSSPPTSLSPLLYFSGLLQHHFLSHCSSIPSPPFPPSHANAFLSLDPSLSLSFLSRTHFSLSLSLALISLSPPPHTPTNVLSIHRLRLPTISALLVSSRCRSLGQWIRTAHVLPLIVLVV